MSQGFQGSVHQLPPEQHSYHVPFISSMGTPSVKAMQQKRLNPSLPIQLQLCLPLNYLVMTVLVHNSVRDGS